RQAGAKRGPCCRGRRYRRRRGDRLRDRAEQRSSPSSPPPRPPSFAPSPPPWALPSLRIRGDRPPFCLSGGKAHDRRAAPAVVSGAQMVWDFIRLNWRNGIEILILSVGIYQIYRAFRATRGARILVGLVVILVALTMLLRLFEFSVISWILTRAAVLLV